MRWGIGLLVFAWLQVASAAVIEQPLADPIREAQARALFQQMKCVVCEGQSLAESDAVLAVQMRAHVRDMLKENKSPEEIVAYFRARYGDHMLLQPPVNAATWLLWAAPLLLLAAGGGLIWRLTSRKQDA